MADSPDTPEYVEFTHPGGHLVARVVVPSIGQAEAPAIRNQVAGHLHGTAKGRAFVLDLSQVSLISSLGLGTCVDLRNMAAKAGVRPVAYGLNRHLMDLFRLMKVDRLFDCPTSPQALDEIIAR